MSAGWIEPWSMAAALAAEAKGDEIRWSVVRDDELGSIATVTINGELAYTAADMPRGWSGVSGETHHQ